MDVEMLLIRAAAAAGTAAAVSLARHFLLRPQHRAPARSGAEVEAKQAGLSESRSGSSGCGGSGGGGGGGASASAAVSSRTARCHNEQRASSARTMSKDEGAVRHLNGALPSSKAAASQPWSSGGSEASDSDTDEEQEASAAATTFLRPSSHAAINAAGAQLFAADGGTGGPACCWVQRARELRDAAWSAAGTGEGHEYACCREAPTHMHATCNGGQQVVVPAWANTAEIANAADQICTLHRLLHRLCRCVFLHGEPVQRPRSSLFWDPCDQAIGFVDAEGMPWFNAAHDPPAPAAEPGSAGSSKVQAQYKATRAQTWYLAACHLVAHSFTAAHGDELAEAHAAAVMHYGPMWQRAFITKKGRV